MRPEFVFNVLKIGRGATIGQYNFESIHPSIPVAPTLSIGHPWNALFHSSFLILDSR
jgi:hypothetical protein